MNLIWFIGGGVVIFCFLYLLIVWYVGHIADKNYQDYKGFP